MSLTRALPVLGLSCLWGCQGDGGGLESDQITDVFISNGHTQCADDALTPAQTAMVLIEDGVDVLDSSCGVLTGVAFAAVCGGATGEINIHRIRPENLRDAERLGFRNVADIGSALDLAATGYVEVECGD